MKSWAIWATVMCVVCCAVGWTHINRDIRIAERDAALYSRQLLFANTLTEPILKNRSVLDDYPPDPWGRPYVSELIITDDVIMVEVRSLGPDGIGDADVFTARRFGLNDDIVHVAVERNHVKGHGVGWWMQQ